MIETKSLWTAETLFAKLKNIQTDNPLCAYSLEKCHRLVPTINKILSLKKEKKALILAHTYVHPDIIYTVADHVGDSYHLAKIAKDTEAETIIFPAVRFMAETAKILNPEKIVIDPNPNGGCSLADSISYEELKTLRQEFPDYTFVCYINTTAAIKSLCDVCVTSSNVYQIIEDLLSNKIYFLPDRLMGQNIKNFLEKKGIKKDFQFFHGSCYVHEEFQEKEIDLVKMQYPNVEILAHPECTPQVVAHASFVGSTTSLLEYVKKSKEKKNPFLLLTECGVASRLQIECPEATMVGACMTCKYMRSNSLEGILEALQSPSPSQIITIPSEIQRKALDCIKSMFDFSKK